MAKHIHKKDVADVGMMLLGCAFYGVAMGLFLSPHVIVAGGVSGIGVIIHALYEQFPVGILMIVINVPILLLSIHAFGWQFVVKSLITIVVLGVAVDLFAMIPSITDNTLLAALYGGVCQGVGIGLFVRSKYSSGGTELLARLIVRRIRAIKITVCLAALDGIIVIAGAIATRSPINMLYALIVIFTSTKMSDLVITGLEKSKLCIIVSDKGREISEALLKNSPRGVTMWNGEGMYTSTEHNVLMTCVKNRQLEQFKSIVKSVDGQAFIMIQDSVEVRGKGFEALEDDFSRPVHTMRKKRKNGKQVAATETVAAQVAEQGSLREEIADAERKDTASSTVDASDEPH